MSKPLKYVLLLIGLFFGPQLWAQFDIPPVPSKQTSLYDYYGLLDPQQQSALENKLVRYSDSTSTQIVIAIISSTEGEYINYLGAQWADQWGIGQAKEDNGIFILLARDDRQIGINTGYGIEPYLTDALSKRIINRDIIPFFKQNDYYGGLDRGTDAIFEVLTGTYQGTRQSSGNGGFPVVFIIILIVFIIIIIALSKSKGGGGSGGRRARSGGLLEAIILSNMGRGSYSRGSGSFGGGGFSGGGFGGGFGGGGFGGGGASGGW